MKPKIKNLPAFCVAGVSYYGKNLENEIALLWVEHQNRLSEFPQKDVVKRFFGVARNFDEESGRFEYLAGIEVTEDQMISEEMVRWEIPQQTYAVCECTLAMLGEKFLRLQNDWLAKSDFERADGPELEIYFESFHFGDLDAIINVCIPIRARA